MFFFFGILLFLCPVLFSSFSHFVFANFSLSFIWNIVPLWYPSLFLFLPLLIPHFPFLKVVISLFSSFHSFKTCSHSHREILTNMHDKGTKWHVNARWINPFGRPLLYSGRTLYVQTVTINSAQPDFDIEISHCFLLGHALGITAQFLVSNERRWTELCNNEHYILWMIQFLVEI